LRDLRRLRTASAEVTSPDRFRLWGLRRSSVRSSSVRQPFSGQAQAVGAIILGLVGSAIYGLLTRG
jgi:hypothetical protein